MSSNDISKAISLIRALSGNAIESEIEKTIEDEKEALNRQQPTLQPVVDDIDVEDDPFDISELDIPDDIEVDAVDISSSGANVASPIAVPAIPTPPASTASSGDIAISTLPPEAVHQHDDVVTDELPQEETPELVWDDSIHFMNAVRTLVTSMSEVLFDVESHIGTIPNYDEYSFNGEYFIKGVDSESGLRALLKFTDLDNNGILVEITIGANGVKVCGVKPE